MNTRGINDPNYGLPSHLSEAMFRRYETFIKQAVDNAPSDTSFSIPEGLAPTTFLARLRDTTLSVKKFGWTTTIDMDKLWTHSGKMVWSYDIATKLVWFRERQSRGRPNQLTSEANIHAKVLAQTADVRWADYTQDELRALCLLLHTKKLTGPFILKGLISQNLIDDLQLSLDISLVHDNTNAETIIT